MNDAPSIDILIVDDSPTARELLSYVLSQDPRMRVVGVAKGGEEALRLVKEKRPTIVTMDLHMPGMDGIETTRRLMQESPLPIVIVSATSTRSDVVASLQAIEAGALAFVARPSGPGAPDFASSMEELVRTVRLMSEVPVVSRRPSAQGHRSVPVSAPVTGARCRVLGIGGSTGALVPLKSILGALPATTTVPVLVVQHITQGFLDGLAEWLGQDSAIPVEIAQDGQLAKPGKIYLAPDQHHLGLDKGLLLRLSEAPPEHGCRPSVSFLFRSLAQNFGAAAAGVILSGMGKDGGAELKMLRDAGGATIAQSEASCVVFGMPGTAVEIGGAALILEPDAISEYIRKFLLPEDPQ